MPFISASVISPYNSIRGGAEGGLVPSGLLLDLYPNAVAAYSLRKLRAAYSGPAIEARKTVGGVTSKLDIGFVGNELDTASLLTFANGGDVFVAKWYDQSGNGNNDAAQVSQSAQPQIVSSGSVINENGKISIKFNGTTDYIENQLSVGPTVTAFAVSRIVDEFDYNFIYDSSLVSGGRIRLGLRNIKEYFADNGQASAAFSTTPSNGLQNLFFAKHTNSDVSISVNQDTLKTLATTNFYANTQYFIIGARWDGAEHFLEGTIQELIFYPSDQTANRAGIESNINSNYKIYWDGSQTGLLDDYPNAAAAYSLRALSSAYTGPAIEVRKTVGGVTSKLDINFRYDGSLDTASLLSFAEGGDVFVAKWYDQSGAENNDAFQISQSSQASIVLSGVLNTTNGKVAAFGQSNTAYVTGYSIFNGADGTYSGFVVSKLVDAFDGVMQLNNLSSGGGGEIFRYFNTSSTTFRVQSWDSSGGAPLLVTEPISANSNAISSFIRGLDSLTTSSNSLTNSLSGLGAPRKNIEDKLFIMGYNGVSFGLESYFSEAILYPSDQTANREGIEANINKNYNIYWDGSQTGLLDDYPNASAAYSLRALNSEYTGPAIKVRRSSDNAEQDINLLYDGSLDTEFLLSFVGAGDGFVTIRYDQSGNGNDLSNISAVNQPKIVSSGQIITENQKPMIDYDGANHYLKTSSGLNFGTSSRSLFLVQKTDVVGFALGRFAISVSPEAGSSWSVTPEIYVRASGRVWAGQVSTPTTSISLISNIYTSGDLVAGNSMWLDGLSITQSGSTDGDINTSNEPMIEGARGQDTFLFDGKVGDTILYQSDQTLNREGIETNINNHYTIY